MPDVIYCYDGTFEGLLCCVFESYTQKETPVTIVTQSHAQGFLYSEKWIETNSAQAARVFASLSKKISPPACEFVQQAFLTCLPDKELYIYRFIRLGYQFGASIMDRLTDDTVHVLQKAVRHMTGEVHLLLGFLRFSQHENVLVSVIHPKNIVLPMLCAHFCGRYPNETFFIFDATNRMGLLHSPLRTELIEVDSFTPPPADREEEAYRALWTNFCQTIAVEGRTNPRCQMTHMPKRYWPDMIEMAPALLDSARDTPVAQLSQQQLNQMPAREEEMARTGIPARAQMRRPVS